MTPKEESKYTLDKILEIVKEYSYKAIDEHAEAPEGYMINPFKVIKATLMVIEMEANRIATDMNLEDKLKTDIDKAKADT